MIRSEDTRKRGRRDTTGKEMALKDVGKKSDKTSSRADEVATRDGNHTLRDCPTGVPLHLSEGEV